jgi:hypothetical protein
MPGKKLLWERIFRNNPIISNTEHRISNNEVKTSIFIIQYSVFNIQIEKASQNEAFSI